MRIVILVWTILMALASGAFALESEPYKSNSLEASLVSVQEGISEDTQTFTAGLNVKLEDGWKTYWRSPGEVGLPPEIDWSASQNIESVDFQYPAPTRFRAFGIENFGYSHAVLFPLQVTLKDAGQPAVLAGNFSLLVCADVCIPDDFTLSLSLNRGSGIDADVAEEITQAVAQVPLSGGESYNALAHVSDDVLTVDISSEIPFSKPDVFTEFGEIASFGAPDIRLSDDKLRLWAAVPILSVGPEASDLDLTVVDGERAVTVRASFQEAAATPPYAAASSKGGVSFVWILFIALIGGLILNVMPCVLPVLSIKFSSALKARDHDLARVRKGFLASALGVMAFMWALALILIFMRGMGHTVGWGVQFQSPVFLVIMLAVLVVFAANMLGAFEIILPQNWMTSMNATGDKKGYIADFSTGALAAVLATPCSAPFLGTAVAFALAGSAWDVVGVFSALGVGLAAPYFLVALRPSLVRALPKPGQWMVTLKYILGAMLLATALWLASVLASISGVVATVVVMALLVALVAILSFKGFANHRTKPAVALSLLIAAIAIPFVVEAPSPSPHLEIATVWQPFDRAEIPKLVSEGKTVFVDATADWCLTCKANKKLVLSKGKVAEVLVQPNVVPMIADWTRQDKGIAQFLQSHGRFGVPFNIVYGPSAPEGIPLPELLTSDTVLKAFEQAGS